MMDPAPTPIPAYDCDGNCLNDADGDGICDEFEIDGCRRHRLQLRRSATDDDGSQEYAEAGYDCDGNCLNDADGDGICDESKSTDVPMPTACNYDAAPPTTMAPATTRAAPAAPMPTACNYDADATLDDASCDYMSCAGCTDADACNYDADATTTDPAPTPRTATIATATVWLTPMETEFATRDDPATSPTWTSPSCRSFPNTLIANVTLDGMPIYGATVIATADGLVVGAGITFAFDGASYVNMNLYLEPTRRWPSTCSTRRIVPSMNSTSTSPPSKKAVTSAPSTTRPTCPTSLTKPSKGAWTRPPATTTRTPTFQARACTRSNTAAPTTTTATASVSTTPTETASATKADRGLQR